MRTCYCKPLLFGGLSALLFFVAAGSDEPVGPNPPEPPQTEVCDDPDATNTGETGETGDCDYPAPEPDNKAPEAVLDVSATEVEVGQTVELGAGASSDEDGTIQKFIWTLVSPPGSDSDFTYDGATATLTSATADEYRVGLEVTDDDKAVDSTGVTITFTAAPEPTRSVTVTAVGLDSGDELANPNLTLAVDGETVKTGESPLTAEVPESAEVTASAERFVSESANRDTRVYADTSLTLEEGGTFELPQRLVPACSDGISNDGDDLVDEDDPGCSDGTVWGYDPSDPNEGHVVTTLAISSFQPVDGDSVFVSSNKTETFLFPGRGSLEPSIQRAIGEIFVTISNKRSEPASFRLRFETGPSDDELTTINTSGPSEKRATDGFEGGPVPGVTREFFANGIAYEVIGVYASGGKSIFLLPDGVTRGFIISWTYEEMDPTVEPTALPQQRAGQAQARSRGSGDVAIVKDGTLPDGSLPTLQR